MNSKPVLINQFINRAVRKPVQKPHLLKSWSEVNTSFGTMYQRNDGLLLTPEVYQHLTTLIREDVAAPKK